MAVDRSAVASYLFLFAAGAFSAHLASRLACYHHVDEQCKSTLKQKRKAQGASKQVDELGVEQAVPPQVSLSPASATPSAMASGAAADNFKQVDKFLSWDCGPRLLVMGLFPNVKEISESMACLNAVDRHLALRFSDVDTLCLVVGDGVVPRTAALLAMRTKWQRVISVDPMLDVFQGQDGCRGSADKAPPVYARHAAASESSAERRRLQAEQLKQVQRLEMLSLPIESVVLDVAPSCTRVVVILPHAHVVPDLALGALRLDEDAISGGQLPTISVVQLPCCKYVKHNTVCGATPDAEYLDECICGRTHGKRTIRVWADVAAAAVSLRAVRLGDRAPLSSRLLSTQARGRKNRRPGLKT